MMDVNRYAPKMKELKDVLSSKLSSNQVVKHLQSLGYTCIVK